MDVQELIERMKSIQPLKNFESIGFSQNTINNWKFRNSFPKSDDLFKISKFLNVSMEYLLTGETKDVTVLTPDEQKIINDYRKMNPKFKQSIQNLLNDLSNI